MKNKSLVITALLLSAAAAHAGVPTTLNYQGRMRNLSGGAPVTDSASNSATFRLYTVLSGGSPIWAETQTGVSSVSGLFNVVLGSVTPLNVPFDQPYYLEVVWNSPSEVLSPRSPLTAGPYAFTAKSLELPFNGTANNNGAGLSITASSASPAASAIYGNNFSIAPTAAFFNGGGGSPLKLNALSFPSNVGTSGQVLTTDGVSTMSWASAAAAAAPLSLTTTGTASALSAFNSGGGAGVYGQSSLAGGYGVWGKSTVAGAPAVQADGVDVGLSATSSSGPAVYGRNNAGGGFQPGALFEVQGTNHAVEGRNSFTGSKGTLAGDLTLGTTGVFGQSGNTAGKGVSGLGIQGVGVQGSGLTGVAGVLTMSAGIGVLADNGGFANGLALKVIGPSQFGGGSVTFAAHVDFSGSTITGWNVPATVAAPLNLSGALPGSIISGRNTGSGAGLSGTASSTAGSAGVYGNGEAGASFGYGVRGLVPSANTANIGVYGTFGSVFPLTLTGQVLGGAGVAGQNDAAGGYGVFGYGVNGVGGAFSGLTGVSGVGGALGSGVFAQNLSGGFALTVDGKTAHNAKVSIVGGDPSGGLLTSSNSSGTGYGVEAISLNGRALVATGNTIGVSATASSGFGQAVYGRVNSTVAAAEFINDGSGSPLKLNNMVFPGTDSGFAGRVLGTDGAGNLTWTVVSVTAPLSLTATGAPNALSLYSVTTTGMALYVQGNPTGGSAAATVLNQSAANIALIVKGGGYGLIAQGGSAGVYAQNSGAGSNSLLAAATGPGSNGVVASGDAAGVSASANAAAAGGVMAYQTQSAATGPALSAFSSGVGSLAPAVFAESTNSGPAVVAWAQGGGTSLRLSGTSKIDSSTNTITMASYVSFTAGSNLFAVPLVLTGTVAFPAGILTVSNAGDGQGVVGYATQPGGFAGGATPSFNSSVTAGLKGYTNVTNSAGVAGYSQITTTTGLGVMGLGMTGVGGYGRSDVPGSRGGDFSADALNGVGINASAQTGTAGAFNGITGVVASGSQMGLVVTGGAMINGYKFPSGDGVTGTVLTTNGLGQLSFSPASSPTGPISLTSTSTVSTIHAANTGGGLALRADSGSAVAISATTNGASSSAIEAYAKQIGVRGHADAYSYSAGIWGSASTITFTVDSGAAAGVLGTNGYGSGVGVYGFANGVAGTGVRAFGGSIGLSATGGSYGVQGWAQTGPGVFGVSNSNYGGYFTSYGAAGALGLVATHDGTMGATPGNGAALYASTARTGSYGIYSVGPAFGGAAIYGSSSSVTGTGVVGLNSGNGTGAVGVQGTAVGTTGVGVFGVNASTISNSPQSTGVYGLSDKNNGFGVLGSATGTNGIGVVAQGTASALMAAGGPIGISATASGIAVQATSMSSGGTGVWAETKDLNGTALVATNGVTGVSSSSNQAALSATSAASNGLAGYFSSVTGLVSVGSMLGLSVTAGGSSGLGGYFDSVTGLAAIGTSVGVSAVATSTNGIALLGTVNVSGSNAITRAALVAVNTSVSGATPGPIGAFALAVNGGQGIGLWGKGGSSGNGVIGQISGTAAVAGQGGIQAVNLASSSTTNSPAIALDINGGISFNQARSGDQPAGTVAVGLSSVGTWGAQGSNTITSKQIITTPFNSLIFLTIVDSSFPSNVALSAKVTSIAAGTATIQVNAINSSNAAAGSGSVTVMYWILNPHS